jgi:NADPH:quinone reductase-like Zn-dependent oxidoreductase
MGAAVLYTLGKPPRYEQFPEPTAGDGEVIVQVHAASPKPIDKQLASVSHYASPRDLPHVCGTDGVGHLSDGQRVFFGGARAPTVRWHNSRSCAVQVLHSNEGLAALLVNLVDRADVGMV